MADQGATLIESSADIRSMYSSKVSQFHSTPPLNALKGISSIWLNMPTSFIRCSALSGANESEQFLARWWSHHVQAQACRAVPEQLGVKVGVRVDKSWTND